MKYDLKYYKELDGARGLAALGVVVAHVNLSWFPNALAMMELFFLISGFLITSILLKKYHHEKKIDLLDFWKRRFLRLYPVLIVVVMIFCLLSYITIDNYEPSIKDGIMTLLYVSNFTKLEEMPYPTLFGQSWSLAIEEQFYLVWPIIFFIALKLNKGPQKIALLLSSLAIITFIWKQYLISNSATWSRLYYGTDTRFDAFLVGGLLAIYYPTIAKWSLSGWTKAILVFTTLLYGIILVLGTTRTTEYFIWQQVIVIIGSSALILLLTSKNNNIFKRIFGNNLSVYLGQRSYSLYLWHWPIIWFAIVLFNPDRILLLFIVLPLTIALSHLSYKYIELPFMARRQAMVKSSQFQHPMQMTRDQYKEKILIADKI